MRKGMFLGKQILLTNKHWERCLKRVDVKGAVAGSYAWFIHVKCPFCKSGGRVCQVATCPLGVYALQGAHQHEWGCVTLFKLVRDKLGLKKFPALFDDYISWNREEDKDARKLLRYIYDGLLSMKTTNRRK